MPPSDMLDAASTRATVDAHCTALLASESVRMCLLFAFAAAGDEDVESERWWAVVLARVLALGGHRDGALDCAMAFYRTRSERAVISHCTQAWN